MQVHNSLYQRVRQMTASKAVVAGAFGFALAAAVGLGIATKQLTQAATPRDCSSNSIDNRPNNGGCGAATPSELIADIQDKQPADLPVIYADSRTGGLTAADYERFAKTAKMGTAHKNGTIVVDGKVVMTNAWSMGREKFNGQRKAIVIGSKTYYWSYTQSSFASESIPVMVMFNKQGVVETAILTACGNPMGGDKVVPGIVCKALNQTQPDKTNKPNTYRYTTTATPTNGATVSRVVYRFSDDNTVVTKTKLTDVVEHTFTRSGTVTVTVFAKVPGGGEVQTKVVVVCQKQVTFVPPMYKCVALLPSLPNPDNKYLYRFTVKTSQSKNVTVESAEFSLDGASAVTVTPNAGIIYKDYTFASNGTKTHTVVVKVTFNTAQGVTSATCKASVTTQKKPMCPLPGKEMYAPEAPECAETPPPTPPTEELPSTGAGSVLGLFAGTSALGALGHRAYKKRQAARR